MSTPSLRADGTTLTGVSETALLTLRGRATEAARPDSIIDDPMAIHLLESIDYDFDKFGFAKRQDVAVRALAVDAATRRYLGAHPRATVVALAEGLQTSFWRLDTEGSEFRWLTVDLPPIVALRERLLPSSPRISYAAQSALDYSWMDRVDTADGVVITAEGLLMYLKREEVMALIAECAKRFPGGQMIFDLPPPWVGAMARRGIRTSLRYKVPPMPFGMTVGEIAALVDTVPGIRAVHDLPMPRGRGVVFNNVLWTMQRISLFDSVRPTFTALEFG